MAALLVIGLRALLGTLVEIIPSFPGTQPLCSFLKCSRPSYPFIRVLLNFPSLTGIKPVCFFRGFRSRSTSCGSSFFLLSLCAPTVFPVLVTPNFNNVVVEKRKKEKAK